MQRTEAGTIFSLPADQGRRARRRREGRRRRSRRCTRPASSATCASKRRATCSSSSCRSGRRSARSTFVGNKEFDTDTVKKALKDIGIAEARIFDRSALDRAEQELKRQYITRGLYAAKVQTTVTPQERNRVAINFTIDEGDAAKIARINIVGNKAFTESELRSRDDARPRRAG